MDKCELFGILNIILMILFNNNTKYIFFDNNIIMILFRMQFLKA